MNQRENIILNDIIREKNIVRYNFSVTPKLQSFFKTNQLIVSYNEDISNVPESILSVSFVGCFMAFSWITDSVLWITDIDKSFYEAIPNIKRAYQEIYSHYDLKGRIVPSIITTNREDNNFKNSMLLFGGGVDANASFIRNIKQISSLCNIQGWFNDINDSDKTTEAEFEYTSQLSATFNLKPILIKSNFAKIINLNFDKKFRKKLGDTWWHGFSHSMSFISIAIPIAYKLKIPEIVIASSLTTGLNHLCASNSTTDNEFKYAQTGHILHDGFELNRQDKINIITTFQNKINSKYYLKVCSFNDKNCCKCEKCFRTILGLIAENTNINNFGFYINDNLRHYWENIIKSNIALMGFNSEKIIHWPHIKKRMKENYPYMSKEYKEFVDWFLNFDFDKEKRKAVLKYRIKNFFPILKRKILNKFTK